MSTIKIKKLVEKEFARIKDKDGIYFFTAEHEYLTDLKKAIFFNITTKGQGPCLYVTLNKGYKTISAELRKQKGTISNVYFIDSSARTKEETTNSDNVILISGPHALTELSLAINAAARTKHFALVFFDSLDTLLIYNDIKTVEKFIHYLISSLRNLHVSGILFCLETEAAKQIIPPICQFCDGCVHINLLLKHKH